MFIGDEVPRSRRLRSSTGWLVFGSVVTLRAGARVVFVSGMKRRYPVGAELVGDGVSFRVWAPDRERVEVLVEGKPAVTLAREDASLTCGAYHAGIVHGARAGDLYRFRLDGGAELFVDPASRFQPDGPHGPSQVIDPTAYTWHDAGYAGIAPERRVVY